MLKLGLSLSLTVGSPGFNGFGQIGYECTTRPWDIMSECRKNKLASPGSVRVAQGAVVFENIEL